jgi:DNA-binding SARP family transcriptional activator
MEFRILGPLEVRSNGAALDLGGPKQRALLALLLLEANRVVPRDRLIDALWDESPPETARKALQVHVSQLRKVLGRERVRTSGPGYQLLLDDDELDLARCRRLQAEGRLDEALGLWRGPPLADVADQRFAQPDVARLLELRLVILEERAERELQAGHHAELAGELEALVSASPLRERLRAQQMLCLYRCGRQAEALDAYRAARAALVEELGIEPSRELRELHQAILRQDPALDLAPAPEAARGVFVGRVAELAALVAGLDEAVAGRGSVFLLAGEPGIGKSRLAEELIARGRARGARVLVGRCWEAGGAPAYWPWVQSLRAYVRDCELDELRAQLGSGGAELARIVPDLRQRLPDLPEPPSLEPESARFVLFDATAEFLRNASARRPLVLFLDDLHAADAPSLLLLRFLARELGSAAMLVLAAYRDVDPLPREPLTEMLAELAREPVARRLTLGGLGEPEVAAYVALTAAGGTAPELVSALHEETEGNPLFVGELVRLLAVEGELTIPQSVRDVIARRLTHLSEEARRVLVHASVLGREFDLEALARIAAVSVDDLLDTIDEPMAARVVSDVPGAPGRLRFAHVLIRDTLYEGLTTARRVRLHRLAVAALEALDGGLAEIAHHCVAGSEFEPGARYGRLAAERAQALYAYEEAARLYVLALAALQRTRAPDDRERSELLLGLGEAEMRAGDDAAAKQAFLDAAGIARRLGLPRELARAAAGYGGRYMWARPGGDEHLVGLLEEALDGLAENEVELRARLLARLAGALRDEPSRERRDRLSREAVELARRSGNAAALAHALDGRAAAITGPDTVAECYAIARELLEVAERGGDRERVANALDHMRTAQFFAGDLAEAEANLEQESRIAHDLRQPAQLWQTSSSGAMLALTAGRLPEAEELMTAALAHGERAIPQVAIPAFRMHRHGLCDLRGCPEEALAETLALVAEYPTRPVFRCALAQTVARLGRTAEAQRALDELMADGCSALPFDQEWLLGLSLLADAAALLEDGGAAAVLYDLLLPWAALNAADHPEGIRGSVARHLGVLAAMTRRPEEAERHFEAALEMNARMGARPWLAYTQTDYARLLEDRDPARAEELAAAAEATYAELGMPRGRVWQRSQA